MNWKCVIVGLTLVFPGTLLSVEGRYYSDENNAVNEQSFLDKLFRLYQQQRQLEKYYTQENEADPPLQKKFDADQPNSGQAGISEPVMEKGAVVATTKRQKNWEKGEINHAVEELQPLPQFQRKQTGNEKSNVFSSSNTVFVLVVSGCTVLAALGLVGGGVCWYKYHKSAKAASVVEYPAYGVTGPTKDRLPSPGDRKLAHSAQMYHYQHQKQQMMAMQSASSGEMKHDGSDDESVEDNDDADYTVYECPGLAPTGEMEVKNPLFRGDDTPSTPANDVDTHPPPTEY